jgi:ubiquitin-protein ligase
LPNEKSPAQNEAFQAYTTDKAKYNERVKAYAKENSILLKK